MTVAGGRTGRRERCEALLLDCDGVLRTWDKARAVAVERRYGLVAGSLAATAFDRLRLLPAITGKTSHAEWMAGVAEALAAEAGGIEQAQAAVAEWQAHRGTVDIEVLGLVRELRARGIAVVLATNATDHLDADLAALDLQREVDVVVNSSAIGHHKPTREYFASVCAAVDLPPARCLLLDDDDRCCRGARAAGLVAFRYTGPPDLVYVRSALSTPRSRR